MKQIPFGRPIIGEEEKQAIAEVLSGTTFVHGPKAAEFEENFAAWTGAPAAVSVSSCTAAMHLAWFDLGLGPGDEVLVPAQTHVATAHAVEVTGARPVFVDADPATGNVTAENLEAALTPMTRGIALVHFLGLPAEMGKVMDLAKKQGLFVLEDCALAMGTRLDGVHAGLHGDVGCFSFYPVKHMTTAEGGMLITKDLDLAERIRRKRAFGVDRTVAERVTPGLYDVTMLGYNYRMNELQAALGIEQLKRMDGFLERRQANYSALADKLRDLQGITLFAEPGEGSESSRYCLSVLLDEDFRGKRSEIINKLRQKGVGTSIYYPRPVPTMRYYAEKYGFTTGDFPVAELISNSSIALPVGPHLNEEDMEYIAKALEEALRETG